MTRRPPEALAACIGSDWAAAKHAICLHAAGAEQRECRTLAHQPDTLNAWVRALRTRGQGPPVALGLALTQGPRVSALRQHACLGLFPVHPLTLARSREAFTPSQAKDDPPDAALQRELWLQPRETLKPLPPQRATMRALAPRVTARRRLVGDTVRLTTRRTRTLKPSCPQALQWFHDQDTLIFCDFLTPWPTLQAVPLARRSSLERCFRDHHGRSTDVIHQRLHAMKRAIPLTTDAGVITSNALLVQALVTPRRATLHAIAACDKAIAQRAQSHPDFPCFDARPGAGAVCAPRLLVACGAQRDRYASADELQQSAGMAPVTARSGNKAWGHWRLQCPTCVRQTFVAWAAAATRHAFWARASYQQQRAKGASHQAAVRALAFTWIRRLFRCWQHRPPYNASVYLNALARRGSPLLHHRAQVS